MKCRKTKKNLSAYLAGELGHRKIEQVKKHLLTCHSCAQELKSLEKLDKKLGQLEEVIPSPGFEALFWRKVKERKQPESALKWLPGPGWTFNWQWGLSTVLAVLVIFGGYIYWERFQTIEGQRGPDISPEMAEIERDMDFYRNYELIKDMDILIKLEKEEIIPENEQLPENHLL